MYSEHHVVNVMNVSFQRAGVIFSSLFLHLLMKVTYFKSNIPVG